MPMTLGDALVRELSESSYRSDLRASVRGLWTGVFNFLEFEDAMASAVHRGLEDAWREGAAECGIGPGERTDAEVIALEQAIALNLSYVGPLGRDIQAEDREAGKPLAPHLQRIELWVNRYQDVMNQAKTLACADQKLKWRLGRTEQHCRSCLALNGKVKRASTWAASGIRPQHPDLECQGYNCDCRLDRTTDALSPGSLPSIP